MEDEHGHKHGEEDKKSEEKPKVNSTLTLIVLAVVLCGGMLAVVFVPKYMHKAELQNDKYNNFEFARQGDNWYTAVNKGGQPYQILMYYHPRDLEDIVVDSTVRDRFFALKDNNGSIFITLDPDGSDNKIVVAGVEIAKVTGTRFGLLDVPTRSAFIKAPANASANTPTPIKTCKDANGTTMVIWLTLSDKNLVSAEGNCIILEAKSYNDTVKVADRLVYQLFGIMS